MIKIGTVVIGSFYNGYEDGAVTRMGTIDSF